MSAARALPTSASPRRQRSISGNCYVAQVVHDLRNPITTAMMHAGLLQELLDRSAAPDEQALRSTLAVQRSLTRAAELVTDLLDLSALEAGALVLSLSAVPLAPLVRDLLDDLRPCLGGRVPEVEVPADLPPLRADRRRLTQVLANLLGNAIKYSPASVPLGVRAGACPRGVRLTVWDGGPGIPLGARRRVFEPFYRLGRDVAQPGTGLGLAISSRLVAAHGGRLVIDQAPGASFSACWPVW